jgi:mono/diheme cytochrome c family protein
MSRPARVLFISAALVAVGVLVAACGTQRISIPKSDPNFRADLTGAQLFSQRCSGCHTLSYAATHGSASNVSTAQPNNGPDFDVRCERPVTRVLYAIENGGFSGAIMPQNVVVGQQAREVATFVAKYAGGKAPKIPGQQVCDTEAIGTLPAPSAGSGSGSGSTTPTATTASTTAP